MLAPVHAWIIDGERWIAERLRFPRDHLAGDLSDDERRAAEAEIEILSKERSLTVGGLRGPRWARWRPRNGAPGESGPGITG